MFCVILFGLNKKILYGLEVFDMLFIGGEDSMTVTAELALGCNHLRSLAIIYRVLFMDIVASKHGRLTFVCLFFNYCILPMHFNLNTVQT